MTRRTAIFAALFALQAGVTQAQESTENGKASFIFNGSRVLIGQNTQAATQKAGVFAAIEPSCDPACIAPFEVAEGVKTVIEPEVLDFLVNGVGKNKGLLVDARMPEARKAGFIPGSVNLPHSTLAKDNAFRDQILTALGVRIFEDVFNFSDAQTLLIYDNGPSQNDAGGLISNLLEAGYPAEKISYYRGGMQVWSVLALTVQE
ncbi:MAG: rhodanese-like domain-containing protein [Sulfitobacter sp.]